MEATRSWLNHSRGGKLGRHEFRPQARGVIEATERGLRLRLGRWRRRGGEDRGSALVRG